MALDALHTALMSQRVNWVLDADMTYSRRMLKKAERRCSP
jgi:hypothetical protein